MTYNPFTSVRLFPSYGFGHVIQWSIDPVFKFPEPHNFTVEVSGTPDFKLIDYTIPAGNAFSAIDNTRVKQSWTLDHYYRVKLTAGNEVFYSQNLAFTGSRYTRRQYVLAREIVRKELLRCTKFTGSQYYLLKRKIYGTQLNDDSVDPVSGVPLTDQVADQGSHFANGYYNPLPFYLSTEENETDRSMQGEGKGLVEITQKNFRTIGFPIIETYDILVEPVNDERYFVKSQKSTYFPSTDLIVVQQFVAQLIPNTDPVYKINVKLPTSVSV